MFSSCFSARDKRSLSQERWKRKAPLPAPDCPIDKGGWLALVPWEAPGPHRTMFTPMLSKKNYTWMMTQMCLQITSQGQYLHSSPHLSTKLFLILLLAAYGTGQSCRFFSLLKDSQEASTPTLCVSACKCMPTYMCKCLYVSSKNKKKKLVLYCRYRCTFNFTF